MAKAVVKGYVDGFSSIAGANLPVSIPADVAVGDWMVVHIVLAHATATMTTVPDGWVQVAYTGPNLGTRSAYVFAKRRGTDEPVTPTWVMSNGNAAVWSMAYGSGGIVDIGSWVKRTYPNDVGTAFGYDKRYTYYLETGGTNGGDAYTTRVRGLPVPAGALVLSLFAEATSAAETDSGITVTGATKTHFGYAVGGSSAHIGTALWAVDAYTAAQTTPDAKAKYPNVQSSNAAGMQLAIPELVETTPNPNPTSPSLPGLGDDEVRYVAGDLQIVSGSIKIVENGNFVDVARIFRFPEGRKVDKWFEGGHIPVMAHRGGSLDWSEHSARGYTECVQLGVDILEISMAKTKDGVWIGIHDQGFDRTTPELAGKFPKDLTWDELRAYTQVVPNGGDTKFGRQPYMKAVDLFDAYARSHGIMIDIKYEGVTGLNQILDICDQYPDAKNTFVVKYFHTATQLADAARARGYKSWGYAYFTDVNGTNTTQLSATQAKWDFLGMEYGGANADGTPNDAAKAAWATVLSYGKPVFAHILPDKTTADRAIKLGANALQVSGVRAVMATRNEERIWVMAR
jgi:glycerophosphoryl diester phosphodiesterase